MTLRHIGALALAVFAGLAAVAYTAANLVPASRAGETTHAVTANQLKPSQCASLNLASVRVGGGGGGGGGAQLVLGTAASEILNGGGGADCIVGGAGIDLLRGAGNPNGVPDICIGGPDLDIATGCEVTYQIP